MDRLSWKFCYKPSTPWIRRKFSKEVPRNSTHQKGCKETGKKSPSSQPYPLKGEGTNSPSPLAGEGRGEGWFEGTICQKRKRFKGARESEEIGRASCRERV